QKFRLRVQVGSLSSEVTLSFEEPWVFQRELALGGSVFRTSSDYNSAYYREVDTGFEIYLRKRLFEFVEARLAYSYSIISIQDVSSQASAIIGDLAGNNDISKVSLQLLRDTRDKIINTTTGNRVEINTSVAGGPLGG